MAHHNKPAVGILRRRRHYVTALVSRRWREVYNMPVHALQLAAACGRKHSCRFRATLPGATHNTMYKIKSATSIKSKRTCCLMLS